MITFEEFKRIAYKMAKPHKVYLQSKEVNLPAGKAMAKRSSSSAGGGGGSDGSD